MKQNQAAAPQASADEVERPEHVTINVQTLSGSLPPISITAQATVRDLKLHVQTLNAAFAYKRQKLFINEPDDAGAGIELLNNRTLHSYQITESTNVVLIMLPSPSVEVRIDNYLMGSDNFRALLENGDLYAISVEVGSIGSYRAKLLQLFDENRAIQSIRISGHWTDKHLEVCEALVSLRPDMDIKVTVNGDTVCKTMLRAVDFCKSNQCSSIELSIFGLENSKFGVLISTLKSMSSLQSLALTDGSISDTGCADLASALQSMSSLKILELIGTNISALGYVALAPVLPKMNSLQNLNLFLNSIGNEGCVALAPALRSLSSLQTLDLSRNDIGNEGCMALAPALLSMFSLQTLNLGHNQIGDEGCQALAPALLSMSSLQSLALYEHRMTKEGCVAFQSSMQSMLSLQIFGFFSELMIN